VSGRSATFTVSSGDVILQTPLPDQAATGPAALRVAWTKRSTVAAVDVLLRQNAGPWTALASGITGVFADVALPLVSTGRAEIAVQVSGGLVQDSTDGAFSIRGGSAYFHSPAALADLLIGSTADLAWVSLAGSRALDLDLWDSDQGVFRPIAANAPDTGHYAWFVPELWMPGVYVRATFRDAAGNALGTVQSPAFNLRYTSQPGNWTSFYRLYSPTTMEHLYTTDANEYRVLGTWGWSQEGIIGDLLDGPKNIGGEEAAPYYRVYIPSLLQHHWTADRNEYLTLRANRGMFNPEHIVGYIFKKQVLNTIPLFRLYHPGLRVHHWTTDAYENQVLGTRGWTQEGIAGYVLKYTGTGGVIGITPLAQHPVRAVAPGAWLAAAETLQATAAFVLNEDGTPNMPANPAHAGSTIILALPASGVENWREVFVEIGGRPAQVLGAGAEIHVRLPADLRPGEALPVLLTNGIIDLRPRLTVAVN
jgi:hypothetical protein